MAYFQIQAQCWTLVRFRSGVLQKLHTVDWFNFFASSTLTMSNVTSHIFRCASISWFQVVTQWVSQSVTFFQYFTRQHCRLTICIELVELTNSIRWQDPNNNTDTETRCLVYPWPQLDLKQTPVFVSCLTDQWQHNIDYDIVCYILILKGAGDFPVLPRTCRHWYRFHQRPLQVGWDAK